jgi:hypothetical protein
MQILVIISFIKLILLKIRVRTVKFQIYEWQRATASGVDETRVKIIKRATVSGAFRNLFLRVTFPRELCIKFNIYDILGGAQGKHTRQRQCSNHAPLNAWFGKLIN